MFCRAILRDRHEFFNLRLWFCLSRLFCCAFLSGVAKYASVVLLAEAKWKSKSCFCRRTNPYFVNALLGFQFLCW